MTTAEPAPVPGDFTAEPGHMPVLDAAGAQAAVRTGLLLDARAPERYRGETEPADPVARHIPGAISAPTAGNVNPDGTFKDAAELAARFAKLLPPGGRPPGTPRMGGLPAPPCPPGASTAARASPRLTRCSPSRWPRPRRALRRLLVQLGGRPRPPRGDRRLAGA